nr:aminotransferase class V-fold PLP-dependent enzyme [Thermoanaerobaculia bacterium]
FVVDVIQGLGALPLDVEACAVDVAAGAGHKWLLGPEGMGLLYVSDRLRGRLRPTRAGWRSVAHRLDFGRIELLWESGARAFECGSLNHLGIRLLGESITLLGEIGIARIEPRVIALARRAAEGMAALGLEVVGGVEGVRSGIVCARHPSRPVAPWVAELERRDIVVAERLGRLRVSPNFYNTEDEVDCFLATLGELVP